MNENIRKINVLHFEIHTKINNLDMYLSTFNLGRAVQVLIFDKLHLYNTFELKH